MSRKANSRCIRALGAALAGIGLVHGPAVALEPPPVGEYASLVVAGELVDRVNFARQLGNHKVEFFRLRQAINRTRRQLLQAEGMSEEDVERLVPVLAPPPAWQGMPSTGPVDVLALLIEFQDHTHTNSQATIQSNLFGAGNPARAPYESLDRYYDRASYQQLDFGGGQTLGWYQTSYPRSDVIQTTTGRENLIKEVIDHFDDAGHDFSRYDNDGNGVIDYFMVFWTGPDTGWSNFWWGYQTSFVDGSYQVDGVRLGRYSWQWESRPVGTAFTPRVAIHETGHALGLPDYYDYLAGSGPDGGVGGLDMMDGNKGDHNCFSKWMLEWLTPIVIGSGSHVLTLNASGTTQDCVVIWPGITTGDLFSEFFIVQNRHRVGNDDTREMPSDGALVWHLDARLNSAGTDFLFDNSFTAHKLLRLTEADGLEEIEGGGAADAGDYYAAGDSFGPTTTPSSQAYDGSDSRVQVSGFSAPGVQMSATFEILTDVPPDVVSGACSLCYTCGGDWPAFAGAIPTRRGANPWERGPQCSGDLSPRPDDGPYLCCKLQ